MLKTLIRKGAAVVSAVALSLGASLSASAFGVMQVAPKGDGYSFTGCVEDKHAASVLIMMDETGSIFGSDPEDLRVAGAEVLLDRLQRVSDVYETDINVMLAGFGDKFVPRPEGTSQQWVPLKPGAPEQGLDKLVATAREWSKETPNRIETDTLSGMAGATAALAEQPSDSCKLFVFFKDGVDFQNFNRNTKNPSEIPGYPQIHDLLEQKKFDQAEADAIDEICRPGGVADGLRIDDNIYTLGVALNTTTGPAEGVDKFVSMIEGNSAYGKCGDRAPKGRVLHVDDVADLPTLFGKALDPDFIPSQHKGKFTVNMKRALTSVNIISSGISSTFDEFTITLAPTCSEKTPIRLTKGKDVKDQVIAGSVTLNAKWAGSNPSTSKTLNITVSHTNQTDDSCWVGTWTIDPGNDALSTLYFDADLKAVAAFEGEQAVLVKGDGGNAGGKFNLQIQHPSDANGAEVPVGSLDPDLDFSITGYLREADSKAPIASNWDGLVVHKADFATAQQLTVDNAVLGDYELVLTMNVTVKGFTEQLSPISTQRLIKIGNPYAAPTIKGDVHVGVIEGASRAKVAVTFVGSKDADFQIFVADMATKVDAQRFPKGLSYALYLPEGVADGIKIPKGETITAEFELGVATANGSTDVAASGQVRGDLIFAAKATDYPSQGVSEVKTGFDAEQKASANAISLLFWVIVFTLIGFLLPVAALVLITVLISRFPKREVSENVTAASFSVRYQDGEITNAEELISQAGNLANFPRIDVSSDRKSASVGFETFKVKVNPFGLKAISHAEFDNSAAVGASSSNEAKPHLSLNLGSEWVFYTDPAEVALFGESSSGSGTLVLVVNNSGNALRAQDLVADFLRNSQKILRSLPTKSSGGIFGGESSGLTNNSSKDDDFNLFGN